MDLANISVAEIVAVADEEVAPLAAELARILAARGAEPRETIPTYYRAVAMAAGDANRRELLQLAAAVLLALSTAKRVTTLVQRSELRTVRLPREQFNAFRLGALRHLVFSKGLYDAPKIGNVIRILETDMGRASGVEALAEVTYALSHVDDMGVTYSVSVRPWRGAGTEGEEIAFMRKRASAILDLEAVLIALVEATPGTQQGKLRAAALRVLDHFRELTIVQPAMAAE